MKPQPLDLKKLIKGLTKYIVWCNKNNDTHTFRGLLGFLEEKENICLDYYTGLDLGLLDLNNALFDLVDKKEVNKN